MISDSISIKMYQIMQIINILLTKSSVERRFVVAPNSVATTVHIFIVKYVLECV